MMRLLLSMMLVGTLSAGAQVTGQRMRSRGAGDGALHDVSSQL